MGLIGVENLIDVDNSGKIVTGAGMQGEIELRNIPIGGKSYRVQMHSGLPVLTEMPR